MRPSLVAAVALVVAAIAGCSDTDERPERSGFVQRPDSRLIKVQSVGLAAFGPINPHTATVPQVREAFGEPSSEAAAGDECRRRWASLGLEIRFEADGEGACAGEGRILSMALTGAPAARAGWNTAEGIRPLQPVDAVERIYPEVGPIGAGAVALVTRPSEFPGPPVLLATIAEGKVETMLFPIDAD
jgi:hypothetical protein